MNASTRLIEEGQNQGIVVEMRALQKAIRYSALVIAYTMPLAMLIVSMPAILFAKMLLEGK